MACTESRATVDIFVLLHPYRLKSYDMVACPDCMPSELVLFFHYVFLIRLPCIKSFLRGTGIRTAATRRSWWAMLPHLPCVSTSASLQFSSQGSSSSSCWWKIQPTTSSTPSSSCTLPPWRWSLPLSSSLPSSILPVILLASWTWVYHWLYHTLMYSKHNY